jgi:hypothetical protein
MVLLCCSRQKCSNLSSLKVLLSLGACRCGLLIQKDTFGTFQVFRSIDGGSVKGFPKTMEEVQTQVSAIAYTSFNVASTSFDVFVRKYFMSVESFR